MPDSPTTIRATQPPAKPTTKNPIHEAASTHFSNPKVLSSVIDVNIPMHAYIGSSPTKPDDSVLRVKDGNQIDVVDGATGEDLLAASKSSNSANDGNGSSFVIVDDLGLGKTIKNWTQSPPLTSVVNFRRLLDAGLNARRNSNGLYGNATEFSSAVLRPGASVRLSEGPLLNKSLFALQEVVESLSQTNEVSIPYQASQLTTLLQDALGGNCLTFVLMCLSPGDLAGLSATLQLGRLLPLVQTFPVVNNDMLRGLRRRQHMASKQIATGSGDPQANQSLREGKQRLADYERNLHDLEGKLARSGLECRVLREDKDILTAQLNELRCKYRELFDNELSLRTELLSCEQEKLALSKAFVAFQLERDTEVQQLDSDKFEAETRLLKAEQLVVEIQQDDATKATQVQDLCAKMNELVADKLRLGGELAMLQETTKAAEEARDAEAKKNQQLNLELIVAVNKKQKLQSEMEALTTQLRNHQTQVDAQTAECKQLRSDNEVLREQTTVFEAKLESIRKDTVRRELEFERAELAVKKEQLSTQQAERDADHQHEHLVKRLNEEIEAQRVTFIEDKRLLELQLERAQHDSAHESREKHHAIATLNAKNEENEELLLALERTRHDLQAQLEIFRLKLALLHQPENGGDRLNEAGVGMRKRLETAELRIVMDMKQLSDQALIIAELEAQKADQSQQQEKQHQQQIALAQNNDDGVRAIAEMHAALTRQLEETQ
ncbi:hypothetical protein BBO99_00004442 [Phytophthora kernoviae]|uniref:Kinesin motor domain-containing protein n=2 Tax=Phytophthora kernoviae TaxID=325452 RepID=A0A3R7KK50_9STRA|nr:hypothetical protein G195_010534 [Phytophthora kernoviae 00238/432]KAG2524525.1 hypothetical protein JM16_004896 [Phytophthora kernoviae]KAG2526221.1 hypothetical protein JM18_004471 [Phytophthora kernoviae]RLN20153.1 hypothetical protein BBI17_004885 [Phytophthora kernoviae]RLN80524.1 hypothetical protein BBO99_00004442 [Phytophthora kernoviae]